MVLNGRLLESVSEPPSGFDTVFQNTIFAIVSWSNAIIKQHNHRIGVGTCLRHRHAPTMEKSSTTGRNSVLLPFPLELYLPSRVPCIGMLSCSRSLLSIFFLSSRIAVSMTRLHVRELLLTSVSLVPLHSLPTTLFF